MTIDDRLRERSITLPEPPPPGGAYKPTAVAGNLLFVSAQFPIQDGRPKWVGKIGGELSVDQGRQAARLAALNALARIRRDLGGFDRLRQVLRLEAHLNTAPRFAQHAAVADGASQLLNEVLGDRAGHTRALFGHATLPNDLAIELVLTCEIDPA